MRKAPARGGGARGWMPHLGRETLAGSKRAAACCQAAKRLRLHEQAGCVTCATHPGRYRRTSRPSRTAGCKPPIYGAILCACFQAFCYSALANAPAPSHVQAKACRGAVVASVVKER